MSRTKSKGKYKYQNQGVPKGGRVFQVWRNMPKPHSEPGTYVLTALDIQAPTGADACAHADQLQSLAKVREWNEHPGRDVKAFK